MVDDDISRPHNEDDQLPIVPTARRYDDRFATSEGTTSSEYSAQYHNRSNLAVQAHIIACAKHYLGGRGGDTLTILDYGAGEGRMWFSTVKFLAEAGINIKYYAVDISDEGLITFGTKLLDDGFKVKTNPTEGGREAVNPIAHLGARLWKENIGNYDGSAEIHMVSITPSSTPEEIQKLVPKVDMTMCIFGVLSHIPGRENRQNFLRLFREITAGDVILTLPNAERSHTEALVDYDLMRKRGADVGAATEPGDVYYRSGADRSFLDFYHLYRREEVLEDFAAAGYGEPPVVGTAKTLKEEQVTNPQTWKIRAHNARVTKVIDNLGPEFIETYATYFLVTGQGDAPTRQEQRSLRDIIRHLNTAENLWRDR